MIRVAILGAGIGKEHLTAYKELPDRFQVAAVCDLDATRASLATENDSSIQIVTDIDAVLSDPTINLIDICLPPQLHANNVISALQHGKHVICEKPIARSLAEIDQMRCVMEQSSGLIFPVFQYRYGLGLSQLKALIENGLTGPALVASAQTHWNRDSDYYAVSWRGTWKSESGGAVLGHAIHAHDLLCSILGPVERVSAFCDTLVNDIEVEDCAALSLRMKSGALVTSSITLGAATDMTKLRFCFSGLTAESGTAPYTPAEDTWTFTARGSTRQEDIDLLVNSLGTPRSGFTGYLEAVADAIDGKPSDEVSFDAGRRSIEFVTAVYHSARQDGLPVRLPLDTDHPLYEGWIPV